MGFVKKHTGIDVAAPVKVVQSGVKAIQNAPGIKQVSDAATKVLQPIEKVTLQPINRGLVSLDKMVGNAIPGGWGTIGTIAASMIPGGQFAALGLNKTAAMTGLGALTGSGVLRPGRSFNLQGAVMGGAMAYGASKLADYAAVAGGAETTPTVDTYGNLTKSGGSALVTEPPMGVVDSVSKYVGDVGRSLTAPPSNLVQEPGIMDSITNSLGNTGRNISNFADKAITPSTYTDFGKAYAQNVSDIGSGIKNLVTDSGVAKATSAATGINPVQAAGATLFGATGLMALDEQEKYLKEQLANQQIAQAEYDQALGEINRQRDYAARVVNENPFRLPSTSNVPVGETLYGRTDRDKNLYARTPDSRSTLYAKGGEVEGYFSGGVLSGLNKSIANLTAVTNRIKSESSPSPSPAVPVALPIARPQVSPVDLGTISYEKQFDKSKIKPTPVIGIFGGLGARNDTPYLGETLYERDVPPAQIDPNTLGLGNLANALKFRLFAAGGQIDDELGGDYSAQGMDKGNLQKGLFGMGYAAGGMPRFLSGGGDGMSDSIRATINDKQPARLADGEFVIPADVVSHLGNGSSKAGAKQLYAMMDKVRKARTGRKSQGKQINPSKYMPA